jgi:hypothetical protein
MITCNKEGYFSKEGNPFNSMTIKITNLRRMSDGSLFYQIDDKTFENLIKNDIPEFMNEENINKWQVVTMWHQTFISYKDRVLQLDRFTEEIQAKKEALVELEKLEKYFLEIKAEKKSLANVKQLIENFARISDVRKDIMREIGTRIPGE